MCIFVNCGCLVCIVVILNVVCLMHILLTVVVLSVLLSSYVYLLYCVCIAVVLLMPDCWLEVSIRKVLRPATSTQVFLGFPASISEC
jgi:hypothetical protein